MTKAKVEHLSQCALVEYLNWHSLPHYSVPNGFWLNGDKLSEGARNGYIVNMKKEGLQEGVLDLIIPIPNQNSIGLAIEMKTNTGKVSKVQKAWIGIFESCGYTVAVCRSADEAIQCVKDYVDCIDKAVLRVIQDSYRSYQVLKEQIKSEKKQKAAIKRFKRK